MKKALCLIVILAMLLTLSACSESKGTPSEDGAVRVVLGIGAGDGDSREYVDTDEPVYSPTPTPTPSPTPTPLPSPTGSITGTVTGTPDISPELTDTPGQKGTFTASDCAVVVNGVTIRPGMDFSGKETSVGKVVEKLEGQSCLDSGYDINYYYDGFNIDTLTQNGKQLVYMACFQGGGAATPRGIGIGSTAGDLISAYGEPADDSGISIAYVADTLQAMFYLDDDVITEIVIVDTSFQ
ncbi:MAG: hypothetical protein J6Y10_07490 [Lachnospiraceae bacterium]|nr:hypothetical protein [Lachnospiraceae bacterium]